MNLPNVEEVGDKTRQGLKWVFSMQVVQKVFFFASNILLARLLSPSDFGLATMAITLDVITWLVLSLGVNSAVMYYQDNIEERFNAAFWLYLFSSAFFVIIQFSAAPLVADFYKEPLLIPIIRFSALTLFITSFGAIQKTILSKSIDYKRLSIQETAMNSLRNILYVSFAFAGFRVWSFIYGKVIVAVIDVICIWCITKWKPKFKFYFKYWGEMLNYGRNVLFSNLIDYILNNATYILIGSMVGSVSLGLYSFAYDKSMMVVSNIAYQFTAIAFPAFARLQDHRGRLKNAFFKAMRIISLVSFPYTFCCLVLGPELINVIFGHKWQPAVILFQIMLFYTMFRSIVVNGNPILQATGNPRIALRWSLFYAPVYISSIYLGYRLGGVLGIAAVTAIVGGAGSLVYLSVVLKVLNWNMKDVYITVKPALLCSIITGTLLFAGKILLMSLGFSNVLILIILMPLSILIYAVSIRLFFEDTYYFILDNLSRFTGRKIPSIFLRNAEKDIRNIE